MSTPEELRPFVVSLIRSLIIFHETEFSVLISDESTVKKSRCFNFVIIKLQC